jgi:hypothetical protein
MAIRFTPGEDAMGAGGPASDQRVKKNAAPAYVAPKGNGSADRPLGLVDLDARVASLEAQVAGVDEIEGIYYLNESETARACRELGMEHP